MTHLPLGPSLPAHKRAPSKPFQPFRTGIPPLPYPIRAILALGARLSVSLDQLFGLASHTNGIWSYSPHAPGKYICFVTIWSLLPKPMDPNTCHLVVNGTNGPFHMCAQLTGSASQFAQLAFVFHLSDVCSRHRRTLACIARLSDDALGERRRSIVDRNRNRRWWPEDSDRRPAFRAPQASWHCIQTDTAVGFSPRWT